MPGKAISHLSRMSLAEFNERNEEMKQEINAPANNGNIAAPTIRQADQMSKAAISTVSKPV